MVESNSRSDQQKTEILKYRLKENIQNIERQKDGRYGKVYERYRVTTNFGDTFECERALFKVFSYIMTVGTK